MIKKLLAGTVLLVTAAALAQANPNETPQPAQAPPAPQGRMFQRGPGGPAMGGPRMRDGGGEMHMRMPGPGGMPGGAWWKNSHIAQEINLTDQQAQQIEKTFQDHRLQLVDLHANLEKAELQLDPMMQADQPNEAQITSQIDKISQARAALEKSNATMLLAIRRILSADQWKKLQTPHPAEPFARGDQGPQGWQGRQPRPGRAMPGGRAPQPAQPGAAPGAAPPPEQ